MANIEKYCDLCVLIVLLVGQKDRKDKNFKVKRE